MTWPPGFPVGISDAIDVLATSVLIYYLLLLIRGTRAVQIIVGLFVLLVILAASNLLHLLVLATVIQYLLLGTAVTLPIVFQPELRRGLEHLRAGPGARAALCLRRRALSVRRHARSASPGLHGRELLV